MSAILEIAEVRQRVSRLSVKDGRYQESHDYGVDEALVCASVPGLRFPVSELFGMI